MGFIKFNGGNESQKRGEILGGQSHQVIENTYRKNARKLPCQDVYENKDTYTSLAKILMKTKLVARS
jgi:hypothetical protein